MDITFLMMEQRGLHAAWTRQPWIGFMAALLLLGVTTAQLRYSISEEIKEGTLIGNVAEELGLDKSILKSRKYRIVTSTTDALFHLDPNDGNLYVRKKIDREEVCKHSSRCEINLKTVLENPLEVHYVSVEVLDINDNSPAFPENETAVEIFESALPGVRIPLQPARDPDGGIFSIQRYKLSPNEHFHLEIKDTGDDGKIPVLIVQKSLDREISARHTLVLTALDGGKPPKSSEVDIIVNVLDANDNAPVFSKDAYSVMLEENCPLGTTVLKVNATDLDSGRNGEVIYTFSNSVNRKFFKLFEINHATGEIIVKGLLDYEARDRYQLEVEASDKGTPPLSAQKSINIKIIDVNDNEPEIEITSFSQLIPEDSPLGSTVALISVNDLDSGLNGKVTCTLNDDIPFILSQSLQDRMYALVTKTHLDRERQSNYLITVRATDAGEPPRFSEKTINVVVSDVNDNHPKFSQSPYTFYVTEGNIPGTSLFSVNAFDHDETSNSIVSYRILKTSGQNAIVSFINVNSESGDIVALKSLDFETLKTFQFQVVATDSGTPSLSSNVTVNVFILDQNDNTPVILYPVSSNGSAEGVEEIPRNVNAGHLVTKVRAYDADIGYNGWLLFSLQEVTDHSLFGLDRYTGQIRTLRSFTETDEAEHKLVILVKDNGNVSLSATATVIVKLVEPKEAFASFDVKSAAKEDEDNNVIFYLMITLGGVSLNNNGVLLVSQKIDREEVCNRIATCIINIKTVLEDPLEVHYVTIENDNPPVILYPVSSNGSAEGVEEIPRNVNAGHLVTKVRAYDADIGYNGWLLFSLQEVTDHSLFGLDRYTGQIRTLRSFTETDEAEHKLVILVKDNGNVSLSATATVIVKLVEPKEAFASFDVKSTAKDDEDNDVTFYLMITLAKPLPL
ncbi:PREDICTED: protocadherin beta-5-like [Cyprinodon variegatus]|uniref:protocadherin beta-5-like n=1 Tax=Cyprinodon variegatus TaxID=28743 RepID=UPI000742963C|nr:PREDICTED: protocadherin beta-5-like [Cyprinodon variegatus]